MKSRCLNIKDPAYEQYGLRGISVCPEWSESFESFLNDMGERLPWTSIDRIDVNKGYEPGNCRWANAIVQGRNKRNNRIVEWNKKQITVAELSTETGVPYQRLHERIARRGWDVIRAVNEKPRGFR